MKTKIAKYLDKHSTLNGLLALSPLIVFLVVYFVSSLIVGDFYKIPIASAFLIASIYSLSITRGHTLEQKVSIFSSGAGNKGVLMMIWIFILAGAFATTAKEIGAIEATVNLTLMILPGKMIFAGLFVAACFISMSVGTSVGTIVALMPIAAGLSVQTGIDPAFMAAIIVGGSFFGDNLSFISDTTIAATRSQGCSMIDKFKANLGIAAPAALVVAVIYVIQGLSVDFTPIAQKVEWVKLIPYLLVLVMAISGVNVMGVLTAGITLNAIIGFACGNFEWTSFLGSVGSGIGSMGELIIVTMLAGGMLEMIRVNGGIDFIIKVMTKRISGKRGAELTIGGLVSLANLCTANNTIAIITTGNIAKDIASRFGVDPRKSASILDTFSCLVQGIIPYGAQMLMATSLLNATLSSTAGAEQVSSMAIIAKLYYPYALGVFAILAILLRFPKKYS